MNGFIYIMSNPAFKDGRLKIGISKSDPSSQRQAELYSTGVPEPFKLEYFAFIENYENVERVVHSRLDDKRPRNDREFFKVSVPEAIIVIRQTAKIKYQEIFYQSPEEIRKVEAEQENKRRREEEIKEAEERKRKTEELERERKLEEERKRTIEREKIERDMYGGLTKIEWLEAEKGKSYWARVLFAIWIIGAPLAFYLGEDGAILALFLIGSFFWIVPKI